MKILLGLVLLFYLGASYSVDLNFSGFFSPPHSSILYIVQFHQFQDCAGTSVESSVLAVVLAFCFSAARHKESPGNYCFSLCLHFMRSISILT